MKAKISLRLILLVFAGAGKDRGSQFGQKDKKPTTPSALSSAARLEHSLVLQSLQECIGPRLSPEVTWLLLGFNSIYSVVKW